MRVCCKRIVCVNTCVRLCSRWALCCVYTGTFYFDLTLVTAVQITAFALGANGKDPYGGGFYYCVHDPVFTNVYII